MFPLAKVALETHALCDIQLRRLANGNPACTFVRVVTLMEFLVVPFFAFAALLVAVGIAQGSQTWEMEDPPYVNVNLRVKRPRGRSQTADTTANAGPGRDRGQKA